MSTMKQQLAPRPPRGQQRKQNIQSDIQIALHTRRTWFLSIVISLMLFLPIEGTLFVINQFFLTTSLFFTISGVLLSLVVFLVVFLSVLLWAVLTAKQRAIGRYRKAVRRSLEKRMKSYYPPRNAPLLSEDQGQHLLLLGLPGGGKTKTLENFLYQAADPSLLKDKRTAVLIQMKYYNGFFNQFPPNTPSSIQTAKPMGTLIAY